MIKKPLVLNGGEIEQLQAGDSLPSSEVFDRTNNNANAVIIGQAVYIDGPGTVDLAQADAAATKNVLGFVADVSIDANTDGGIQTDGILVATTGQWDDVTGGANGLVAGDLYYLSDAVAGRITSSPPTADGSFVARVGQALSTTEFEIQIEPTIKL